MTQVLMPLQQHRFKVLFDSTQGLLLTRSLRQFSYDEIKKEISMGIVIPRDAYNDFMTAIDNIKDIKLEVIDGDGAVIASTNFPAVQVKSRKIDYDYTSSNVVEVKIIGTYN